MPKCGKMEKIVIFFLFLILVSSLLPVLHTSPFAKGLAVGSRAVEASHISPAGQEVTQEAHERSLRDFDEASPGLGEHASKEWLSMREQMAEPQFDSADHSWLDFDDITRFGDFAYVSNNSVELVIGLNNPHSIGHSKASELVSAKGGQIVDTVQLNDKAIAIVTDIPIANMSTFVSEIESLELSSYVEPNIKFETKLVPNDPEWLEQWGPKKIGADEAWNTTTGNPSILVAIVDTGIDWSHPDLAANYVALGRDWVNNDDDPADDFGHGTHCAGIVAATLNNNIGIAGIAQVRIMAEKGIDAQGSGYGIDLFDAIVHAVDQGADIISMSWGSYGNSELLHSAIKYAYDAGVLLVAAAGNEDTETKLYPAAYDEVIAVAATDQSDRTASFSNYGNWIELAAPGVNIYSTMPTYHATLNDYGCATNYDYLSGTSMACVHVAGVAALLWSRFPTTTRNWVRTRLQFTAQDLWPLGFDSRNGHGRIDARKALEQPEHDVLIEDWKKPKYVDLGKSAIFETTIFNFGSSDETNISVQLLVDEQLVDSATVSFLQSLSWATVNCSCCCGFEGAHKVRVQVIPVLGENDTANNAVSGCICVGTKTLRVPADLERIQEALDMAESGFTILVSVGYYEENLAINKSVLLVGESRENTTVAGTGNEPVISIVDNNVSVYGFLVDFSGTGRGIVTTGNRTTVTGNKLKGYGGRAIEAIDSSGNYIGDNVIEMSWGYSARGISLRHSSNNTLTTNDMLSEGSTIFYGFFLEDGSCGNNITHNNVTSLYFGYLMGVRSEQSQFNRYFENTIVGYRGTAFILHLSGLNTLRNNCMTGKYMAPLYVLVWDSDPCVLSHFIQDIDPSNLVNEKPIYYLVNQDGLTIDQLSFPAVGYLALVNSTNVTVRDLTIENCYQAQGWSQGLFMGYTNNSVIERLNVTMNVEGILMICSHGNTVRSNNAVWNFYGIKLRQCTNNMVVGNYVNEGGIEMVYSRGNVIIDNTVRWSSVGIEVGERDTIERNNLTGNLCGIRLAGSAIAVVCNNIVDNSIGIELGETDCLITRNNVVDNGIDILVQPWSTCNATIYHNNFVGKAPHVRSRYRTSIILDGGYPSGGNYWSDYAGVDMFSGCFQNETGVDLIGDSPFPIDENNTDRYPLIQPWNQTKVFHVVFKETVYSLPIDTDSSVTHFQFQKFLKQINFNVTTSVGAVGFCNVTVPKELLCALPEEWIILADGVPIAYAVGENATHSRICSTHSQGVHSVRIIGIQAIRLVGDVNDNGVVDISDIIFIATIYGCREGDPRWNVYADLAQPNGVIDLLDLVTCAHHFGESYP